MRGPGGRSFVRIWLAKRGGRRFEFHVSPFRDGDYEAGGLPDSKAVCAQTNRDRPPGFPLQAPGHMKQKPTRPDPSCDLRFSNETGPASVPDPFLLKVLRGRAGLRVN